MRNDDTIFEISNFTTSLTVARWLPCNGRGASSQMVSIHASAMRLPRAGTFTCWNGRGPTALHGTYAWTHAVRWLLASTWQYCSGCTSSTRVLHWRSGDHMRRNFHWEFMNAAGAILYTTRQRKVGIIMAVLHWVRANGCPWDAATCYAAAEARHLGLLQWVGAKGCP